MSFDWKHLVAAGVGLILGVLGAQFGIDFTKSCPSVPPAAAVTK